MTMGKIRDNLTSVGVNPDQFWQRCLELSRENVGITGDYFDTLNYVSSKKIHVSDYPIRSGHSIYQAGGYYTKILADRYPKIIDFFATTSAISWRLSDALAGRPITIDGVSNDSGIIIVAGHRPYGKIVSCQYADKIVKMPDFYDMPYDLIDAPALQSIIENCPHLSKIRVVYGTMGDTQINLALVYEDRKNIYINALSLAGLYFLKEIALAESKVNPDEFKKALAEKPLIEISKKIFSTKARSIAEQKRKLIGLSTEMIDVYRKIHASENTTDVDYVSKLFSSIRSDAQKIKDIVAIGINSESDFCIIIDSLKLVFFTDELGSFTKRVTKVSHTADLGPCYINLSAHTAYSLPSHDDLQHPHILDSEVCLGSGESMYAKLVGSYDIIGAFKLMRALLGTYNPESPHHPVYSLDEVKRLDTPSKLSQQQYMDVIKGMSYVVYNRFDNKEDK